MRKWIAVVIALTLVTAFAAGCGGDKKSTADAPKKAKVLRVGHTLTDDSHYGVGLAKFAELVKAKSNGTLEVQVFGNAKLGSERDLIEGVSMGTIEMTLSSTGPLPSFSTKFMVFDLPFIAQDRAKLYKVLDGVTGEDMLKSLSAKGIKGLVFFENGFRHITNSKRPINKPEDLVGLKIRLMENPVHMATFKAYGANPLPMPFGELFTAMQQKTVDGQENPLILIKTSKFYEVQKHLAISGHFYSPAVLLVNDKLYKSLTPAEQKALMDAAKESRDFERKFIADGETKMIDELKKAGMEVTYPDKALFKKAAESVYKEFEGKIGKELIQALQG